MMSKPTDLSIFNPLAFNEIRELDESGELLDSLILDYRFNSINLLEKICDLQSSTQFEFLEHALHSLKSSSALLGLERLAGICQLLENQARDHHPIDNSMVELKREYEIAIAALDQFKQLSSKVP